MNLSVGPYGTQEPNPRSARLPYSIAPVNRIVAVSPAARATCKMTPVKIPLIELGKTMVRIVCHRDAPRFQQASRNDIGTLASASRVEVMITGSVITATVHAAAISDLPMFAKYTNAPT